jgi:hypothetical protein
MSMKNASYPHVLQMSFAWSMVCVLALSLVADSAEGADQPWEKLLGDGYQELWRGYKDAAWPQGWVVENGVLTRAKSGDDLMTVAVYADFVLRLEWKISPGGNSGIMYRVSTGDDASYFSGPEFQVLDNVEHRDGKESLTSTGSLYALYAPEHDVVRPVGQWNSTQIVARGNHVEHCLNSCKIVDCEIGSDDWNELVKNSKFAEWPKFGKNREGHIALQDHGDMVWYRNIRIRRLVAR